MNESRLAQEPFSLSQHELSYQLAEGPIKRLWGGQNLLLPVFDRGENRPHEVKIDLWSQNRFSADALQLACGSVASRMTDRRGNRLDILFPQIFRIMNDTTHDLKHQHKPAVLEVNSDQIERVQEAVWTYGLDDRELANNVFPDTDRKTILALRGFLTDEDALAKDIVDPKLVQPRQIITLNNLPHAASLQSEHHFKTDSIVFPTKAFDPLNTSYVMNVIVGNKLTWGALNVLLQDLWIGSLPKDTSVLLPICMYEIKQGKVQAVYFGAKTSSQALRQAAHHIRAALKSHYPHLVPPEIYDLINGLTHIRPYVPQGYASYTERPEYDDLPTNGVGAFKKWVPSAGDKLPHYTFGYQHKSANPKQLQELSAPPATPQPITSPKQKDSIPPPSASEPSLSAPSPLPTDSIPAKLIDTSTQPPSPKDPPESHTPASPKAPFPSTASPPTAPTVKENVAKPHLKPEPITQVKPLTQRERISQALLSRSVLDLLNIEFAKGEMAFPLVIEENDVPQGIRGMLLPALSQFGFTLTPENFFLDRCEFTADNRIEVVFRILKDTKNTISGEISIEDKGDKREAKIIRDFAGLPFGMGTFVKLAIGSLEKTVCEKANKVLHGVTMTGFNIKDKTFVINGEKSSD